MGAQADHGVQSLLRVGGARLGHAEHGTQYERIERTSVGRRDGLGARAQRSRASAGIVRAYSAFQRLQQARCGSASARARGRKSSRAIGIRRARGRALDVSAGSAARSRAQRRENSVPPRAPRPLNSSSCGRLTPTSDPHGVYAAETGRGAPLRRPRSRDLARRGRRGQLCASARARRIAEAGAMVRPCASDRSARRSAPRRRLLPRLRRPDASRRPSSTSSRCCWSWCSSSAPAPSSSAIRVIAHLRSVRANAPSLVDRNKHGAFGLFFKCARIGERLSPYVALACVVLGTQILIE